MVQYVDAKTTRSNGSPPISARMARSLGCSERTMLGSFEPHDRGEQDLSQQEQPSSGGVQWPVEWNLVVDDDQDGAADRRLQHGGSGRPPIGVSRLLAHRPACTSDPSPGSPFLLLG
jgi:hypothetical protein